MALPPLRFSALKDHAELPGLAIPVELNAQGFSAGILRFPLPQQLNAQKEKGQKQAPRSNSMLELLALFASGVSAQQVHTKERASCHG